LGDDGDIDGDPIPTSATPAKLAASSDSDGYVYMGFQTGTVGVITENPWIDISSVAYSDEEASLGMGGNFTTTFTSSQDGTYEIRVGGSVDASGELLTDSAGATEGSITADTETTVTINYDDNSSAFDEGANALWVFVTSDSLRGRRATELTVDTPPPVVTIHSTGFGNESVYVTFERIDVSDMSSYRLYVGTSEEEVLTKEEPNVDAAQEGSGDTQTVRVEGLTNGILYYIAIEAVDTGGNISPSRSVTTETPEETIGPLGLLGE
ncbi:unnamed protein product, partial [marine sediment metagenome]